MEIKVSSKYEALWTAKTRYILVTGGRGSGKSFGTELFLTDQSYNDYFKALVTRYTLTSAHDSIIPEFKDKIDLLRLHDDFNITKTDIQNKRTDNDIMFRGVKTSSGDQTAKLKSIEGVTHFIVEEAEEFTDEETFDTIDLSVRTKKAENRVILIMNPSSTNHWIYKRWIQNTHRIEIIDGCPIPISTHPDVAHIHTTYLDNYENLEQSFIDTVDRMKAENKDYYNHKILGAWKSHTEGAVITHYKHFKRADLPEVYHTLGYVDVADEGTDYTVFVIGAILDDRLCILDVVSDQRNADITLPRVISMANNYQPSYIRCESNNMGAMYGRRMRDEYHPSKVLLVSSTTNKHTRILMEAPFIMDYVYFLAPEERSEEYQIFLNHVLSYDQDHKKNKHDDHMDALSGISMMARGFFPSVFKK
jgi:predicted phage terminase large subunit-like protein